MTYGTGYGSGYSTVAPATTTIKARRKPYFKQQPQFLMPLTKAVTVKFKIPVYWANKIDIDLELPVYYDVVYTKRITTHSLREQKIRINTSKTEIISKKLETFTESVKNMSLKPDFRLQKIKNLTKLKKLLNNMENVD